MDLSIVFTMVDQVIIMVEVMDEVDGVFYGGGYSDYERGYGGYGRGYCGEYPDGNYRGRYCRGFLRH